MNYGLPTTAIVGGREVPIRTDFRVALDIMEAMNDPELDDGDRAVVALQLFYPKLEDVTEYEEAIKECFIFLDGGTQSKGKGGARLVDWEQDFQHIISPVNRVLGFEARAVPYKEWYDDNDGWHSEGGLHWWTFLAAYMEMGSDCMFSTIVSIRDKVKRHKKLNKEEREWYRRNRDLVDIKTQYTEAENDLEKEWT